MHKILRNSKLSVGEQRLFTNYHSKPPWMLPCVLDLLSLKLCSFSSPLLLEDLIKMISKASKVGIYKSLHQGCRVKTRQMIQKKNNCQLHSLQVAGLFRKKEVKKFHSFPKENRNEEMAIMSLLYPLQLSGKLEISPFPLARMASLSRLVAHFD